MNEGNRDIYEEAKRVLKEKGILTQEMIINLGVGQSGASWIIKKMIRDKLIIEGDGYGLYFPYKELSLDEILQITKTKKVDENIRMILETMMEYNRAVRPHEVYRKLGMSEGWWGWNITRCINFDLVEQMHRGLYSITGKGIKFLEMLKRGVKEVKNEKRHNR